MSLAQPGQADSRMSPGLQLNLSSNNPFRNRAASPAFSNGQRSPQHPPPRPVSRNPFLDSSSEQLQANTYSQQALGSPDKMAFAADSQPRPALTGNAADLFDNLTLDDKPATSNTMRPPPPRTNTGEKMPPPYTTRGENVPPRGPPRGPSGHRPSRSQEEAMRARRIAGGSSISKPAPSQQELDIFADPVDSSTARRLDSNRRVRRNSESSVVDRKPLDPEEEKKRQERKRRERRERREREGKDPKRKPDRKLDIIDKLDVTSIYGTGLFHHDGPFDACNPHRNRQGSRRAPMQAFPKDSLNNVLGGGGPINKRPDHATFLGQADEEAFKEYSKGGAGNNGYEPYDNPVPRPVGSQPVVQSATTRVEPIHGEETLGLGTSTFLEGAPASRAALQRRESEQTSPTEVGGLGRKKSLAQKIRGINGTRRDYGPSGRITSPEGMYSPELRTPGGSKVNETNPFFNEFGKGDDKKESITIVEPEKTGRARAPSSPPRRGFGERLERRVTGDGTDSSMPPATTPKTSGGFLSRVKSLKGGPRKARAERSPPQDS
ncbi:Pal1 cell morphology protein-like protein [Rhexocercosporidium sp. MPI-PUGE-AT-0058]|nr:Pal1 cell morphology protein-like protein [Rhexocercosporidium sp. MPI-PUGE-AT-0058]